MGEATRRGDAQARAEAAIAAGRLKDRRMGLKLYRLPIAAMAAINTALGPFTRAKKISDA